MAGYINRREAEQMIADLVNLTRGRCPTWDEVHEALYDLPFVELVRCKDCKYGHILYADYVSCLISYENESGCHVSHKPDWFCADGRKKDGVDN